ncbi:MAG TPA: hypothetical protein DCG28_04310, partial [Lachnospiraceae bacterium]|nr:hypothetical protein [Lachnospiraceae bacterium]
MAGLYCEDCGGETIIGNGCFVCQKCGREYALAELNKLLENADKISNATKAQNEISAEERTPVLNNVTPLRPITQTPVNSDSGKYGNITPLNTLPTVDDTFDDEDVFIDTLPVSQDETSTSHASTPIEAVSDVSVPVTPSEPIAPVNNVQVPTETVAPKAPVKPDISKFGPLKLVCDACGGELEVLGDGSAKCVSCKRFIGPDKVNAKKEQIENTKKALQAAGIPIPKEDAAPAKNEAVSGSVSEEKTSASDGAPFMECDECGGVLELQSDGSAKCNSCRRYFGPDKIKAKKAEYDEKMKIYMETKQEEKAATENVSVSEAPVASEPVSPVAKPVVHVPEEKPATPVSPVAKPVNVPVSPVSKPVATPDSAKEDKPAAAAPEAVKPAASAAPQAVKPATSGASSRPVNQGGASMSFSYSSAKPIRAKQEDNVGEGLPELHCDHCGSVIKIGSVFSTCTGCGKKFMKDRVDAMLAKLGVGENKAEEPSAAPEINTPPVQEEKPKQEEKPRRNNIEIRAVPVTSGMGGGIPTYRPEPPKEDKAPETVMPTVAAPPAQEKKEET